MLYWALVEGGRVLSLSSQNFILFLITQIFKLSGDRTLYICSVNIFYW